MILKFTNEIDFTLIYKKHFDIEIEIMPQFIENQILLQNTTILEILTNRYIFA